MQTNSYISAAALAAALLASPFPAVAQGIGVNVDAGPVGVSADVSTGASTDASANISVGGSGTGAVNADAGASLGNTGSDSNTGGSAGGTGLTASVSVGSSSSGSSATSGPNGGQLIDLKALGNAASAPAVPADGGSDAGNSLITGDVRIAALGDDDARAEAMLDLIEDPQLADIDLDAAIDDRQVAILAAADLLTPDQLRDVEAAAGAGGAGRQQLLSALSSGTELGSILSAEGISADDVLAVQIAESGATEVIVLPNTARVAALGNDGNLADASAAQLAKANVDLLSADELAEAQVSAPHQTARVRLFSNDNPDDGTFDIADLSVADLANVDVDLLLPTSDSGAGDDGSSGGDTGKDNGGDTGSGSGNNGDTGAGGDAGGGDGTGTDTGNGNSGGLNGGDVASSAGGIGKGAGSAASTPAALLPATQVGANFGIAALGCNVGVLALANGSDPSPQEIADAESLELVRINGCARSLVDADVGTVRGAIAANPVIVNVLDQVSVPVEGVIGATVQADTLTLFIDPDIS